jgi:HK97 family phage portal protein
VWGALRLRADLISTLPVDVFRMQGDRQVQAQTTPLFVSPAEGMLFHEWCYSSQVDLDRYGNTFGQIVGRDAAGWPTQVELWPASDVAVLLTGMRVTGYRFAGKVYSPRDVWHERQYTVAGLRVGLSPIAYAAWSVGNYLSAQEFALDWYAAGAHPAGTLRHTEAANLDPKVLDAAKQRFKVATQDRDIFATGKEWEFIPAQVDAQTSQFLEQMRSTAIDVCRFIGVPSFAIDASISGSAITYQNVTQAQLFLLVNHLGPAILRRERHLSHYGLPAPRFMKLNSDALLRLDPTGRTDVTAKQIDAWIRTPDEVRALENLPPLTAGDIALLVEHKQSKPSPNENEGTTP